MIPSQSLALVAVVTSASATVVGLIDGNNLIVITGTLASVGALLIKEYGELRNKKREHDVKDEITKDLVDKRKRNEQRLIYLEDRLSSVVHDNMLFREKLVRMGIDPDDVLRGAAAEDRGSHDQPNHKNHRDGGVALRRDSPGDPGPERPDQQIQDASK